MKLKLLAAAVATAALAACAQQGSSGPTSSSSPMAASGTTMAAMPMTASTFAQMAASSGLFEVQSSQLAMSRSQSQVRSFAQQMVQDHDRANRELMALAQANNMPMTPRMNERHQGMLDQLAAAGSGPAFDQRYMQQQAMAHDEAVTLFSNYAQNGDNPQLREFARRTLPALQQHQQTLRSKR